MAKITSMALPAPSTQAELEMDARTDNEALLRLLREGGGTDFNDAGVGLDNLPPIKTVTPAASPVVPAAKTVAPPSPVVPAATLGNGVSQTPTSGIASPGIGALGKLTEDQAKALGGQSNIASAFKLAQAFAPKPEPVNKWEESLKFFLNVGALSADPKQTFLTSLAGAGKKSLEDLVARRKKAREAAAKTLPTAIALATAMKPKGGVPKSVMGGPVTNEDGSPVLDQTTGKPLYKYTTYSADGETIGTFDAPMKGGGGVTVNSKNNQETAFGKKIGAKAGEQFSKLIDASRGADAKLDNLKQMGSILRDSDFKTGKFQEFMLPFRQWAKSLGLQKVDSRIDSMEKQVVGVDGVINAELFRAKASQLVLDSVAQMKGALSEKELVFLAGINPSLAKTKETNQILVLLAQQQMEKIQPFQDFSIEWQDKNGPLKNQNDFSKMTRAFRKRPEIQDENPYQYILRKGSEYEARLLDEEEGRVGGSKLPRNADNTLADAKVGEPPEYAAIRARIEKKITSAFPVAVIRNIFKGSAFYNK